MPQITYQPERFILAGINFSFKKTYLSIIAKPKIGYMSVNRKNLSAKYRDLLVDKQEILYVSQKSGMT
jgi:hypothetical protein